MNIETPLPCYRYETLDVLAARAARNLSDFRPAGNCCALVEQFRRGEAASLGSFVLLEQIFDEQCEVVDDPDQPVTVRPPRTKDCHTILSPADPDASYNKHKGVGYMVQIMEIHLGRR